MKVGTLRQRHPDYDGQQLDRYRALYEGGKRWREHLNFWLPKNDVEPDDRWKARKKAATYTNHVGAIVDFFSSHLFSEPLSLDGVEDEWLAGWEEDVDQAGTVHTYWWATLFLDAMIARRAYCWVNLPPRTGEFASLGDQLKAGALDAYLVRLPPEQVIWVEREGGRIKWLLTEDVVEERSGVEANPRAVWRWTYIDDEVIRRWEWEPKEGQAEPRDEDLVTELDPIPHGFGQHPVVELDLTSGLWALAKLADPALAHLRARNDLSWALHLGANPLLVVKSKGQAATPVLGSGYFLKLGPDDNALYVEPSGANYQILADDVVRLREELYRVVQQLAQSADSNATRTQMSGESKQADWQAEEIVLAAYAAAVKKAVVAAVKIVAKVRDIDAEALQVGGLEGWHQNDLASELEAMAMALDAHKLSPTFQKEVAKRQAERVLGGSVSAQVMDDIRSEIDNAQEDGAWRMPPTNKAADEDPDAEP